MTTLFPPRWAACAALFLTTALAAASSKADFQLKNDSLVLGFDTTRHVLVSLQDPRTGHEFIESLPESPLLWMLSMEKKDGTRFAIPSSAPAVRKVKKSAARNEITLLWSGLEVDGEPNAMEVRVIVTLPQDGDRSYWRIEVDNRSRSSLMDLQFPYVSGLSREGQPSAAIPRFTWGNLEKEVVHTRGAYPASYWPIQFLSLLEKDSGLYIGFEDPQCTHKYFDLKPGDFFSFTSFAENASLPGNDYVSPGPVAIGVCGSDWWKAAKMYRKWALQQEWTKRGPLAQASNVPDAGKNVGIWFNEYCAPNGLEAQKEQIEGAAEFYKIPFSAQIYFWHKPINDREFPEYFPARPAFAPLVQAIQSHPGAMAMPYVNGRLQDVAVPSAEVARPFMVKRRDGTIHEENYDPGVMFAVMCPATAYWQDVMIGVSRRLVDEYGVEAVYSDQVAAAEPIDCFDPSHNHTLGGGGHWVSGYRRMLQGVKNLKTKSGQPVFLASENTAEPYMDTVDAFLTWTPRHETDIPLITAVYSGYTIYFATNPQFDPQDGLDPFALAVGRDLLWGTQPGWMQIDTTSERAEYLRDVSRIRYAARRYFQFGELMAPPPTGLRSRRSHLPLEKCRSSGCEPPDQSHPARGAGLSLEIPGGKFRIYDRQPHRRGKGLPI